MSTTDLFERRDLGPYDGDQQRERIEQAHLLTAMMDTPGWAILEAIVTKELTAWQSRIMAGQLDVDEYRHHTGYVRGLRSVLDTPQVFATKVARDQLNTPNEEE